MRPKKIIGAKKTRQKIIGTKKTRTKINKGQRKQEKK